MSKTHRLALLASIVLGVNVVAWSIEPHQGHDNHAATEKKDSHEGKAIWADLKAGNTRFVEGKSQTRELLHSREELAKGQHPKVMVLACADSRVAPEIVFDKNIGDLFVVRVAGNVAEPTVTGSLEYAAEHLHAKVLVVLGHDSCGAVAAAASGSEMPTDNLKDIVKRIQPALATVKACDDKAELSSRQIQANVLKAADDLLKTSPILKKEIEEGHVTLVRAVYHLKTGVVEEVSPSEPTASVDGK